RSRCMGRARGGLTAKIHAVVDARGRPIRLNLTEGQAHDGRSGDDMVGSIGAGRILLAGRGYDRDRLRDRLAERGARANIRPIPTRKRFPPFDPVLCRARNQIERFFGKLKHFRSIATRYDKRDGNFLASVQLASIRIWLRRYVSVN
ncbi:IS5 family transposase, partial [Paracoccus pantotrophus]|uniref:IS5 family transposase n=6 Tax=Paracoccus TaxID=265 RepID=UPI0012DEE7E0